MRIGGIVATVATVRISPYFSVSPFKRIDMDESGRINAIQNMSDPTLAE
jgi:hypothetical protein